jgi:hypothetical protein
LQSKEEDQMWKILKMDESTIPCMCHWSQNKWRKVGRYFHPRNWSQRKR